MKTEISKARDPRDVKSDALVEFVFEGETDKDAHLLKSGVDLSTTKNFTGKKNALQVEHLPAARPAEDKKTDAVILAGAGTRKAFDRLAAWETIGSAMRRARDLSAKDVAVLYKPTEGVNAREFGEIVGTAAGMVDYVFHRKTGKLRFKEPVGFEKLTVVNTAIDFETAIMGSGDLRLGLKDGTAIAECVHLSRDLSNESSDECTPQRLAAVARRIAKENREYVTCKVFGKKGLLRMGAGAILGVNRGSPRPPVLVHLTYTPDRYKHTICLIGKGITMDTGGYDIKTGGGMEKMRLDMTGAAVSMSAFQAIVRLKLPIRVHCIFAATENMISGEAQVAGTIIETMSGLSVEVVNTDAEGRLILADCIAYAKRFNPDYCIDMATLTGAARQATDDAGACVFSNDHELVSMLGAAAYASGEFIQPMILFESLRDRNRSPRADLKNSGGVPGHTTAAWFLAEFYEWEKKVAFAHFDIAGMSYRESARGVYPGESASGWGVLLLVEFARLLSRKAD